MHPYETKCVCVCVCVYTHTGYLVAAGNVIQIWDVSTAQLLHTLRPNGTLLRAHHTNGHAHHHAHQNGSETDGDSDSENSHSDDDEGIFEGLDEELLAAEQAALLNSHSNLNQQGNNQQQNQQNDPDGGGVSGQEDEGAPFHSVAMAGHLLAAGEDVHTRTHTH